MPSPSWSELWSRSVEDFPLWMVSELEALDFFEVRCGTRNNVGIFRQASYCSYGDLVPGFSPSFSTGGAKSNDANKF